MADLSGKNILVTGGARGLGRGYALHLAARGANVGIFDRDLHSFDQFQAEAKLMTADTVMDEIRALGVKSFGAQVDVTDSQAVFAGVEAFLEALGSIDVVVCNAGGGEGPLTGARPSTMDLGAWQRVLDRNLNGTVYTIAAVAPHMKAQRHGKIITVSSQVGVAINATGAYAHYCAAKAAIVQYTKCLAQDVGPYGVTANCIAPGDIATARLAERFQQLGAETRLQNIALRRFGTVEECAKVVEFLASDMSDYVSGAVIEVSGGATNKCFTEFEDLP